MCLGASGARQRSRQLRWACEKDPSDWGQINRRDRLLPVVDAKAGRGGLFGGRLAVVMRRCSSATPLLWRFALRKLCLSKVVKADVDKGGDDAGLGDAELVGEFVDLPANLDRHPPPHRLGLPDGPSARATFLQGTHAGQPAASWRKRMGDTPERNQQDCFTVWQAASCLEPQPAR